MALTGKPINIEEESPALNKWFEVYAIRVGSAEERKVDVYFTDITGRKKAEDAVMLSVNNLRNIIVQAPVAMGIFRGAAYVIVVANEKMFEFLGKPSGAMLGRPLFGALPEA